MRIKILSVVLLLSACTSGALNWQQNSYTVQAGDTLYSISWRHRLDHRELARWNQLAVNATLQVGQRLRVVPSSARPTQTVVTPTTRTTPRPVIPVDYESAKVPWRWPLRGAIVSSFSSANSVGKGIDIAAKAGAPVHAAAEGRVVYAGNGLIGYGELLIIKHNDVWLSAYGFNRRLLVKEGQSVSAGQLIAEVGRDAKQRERLHFEIRKNGQPVDPIRYLPK